MWRLLQNISILLCGNHSVICQCNLLIIARITLNLIIKTLTTIFLKIMGSHSENDFFLFDWTTHRIFFLKLDAENNSLCLRFTGFWHRLVKGVTAKNLAGPKNWNIWCQRSCSCNLVVKKCHCLWWMMVLQYAQTCIFTAIFRTYNLGGWFIHKRLASVWFINHFESGWLQV